MANTEGPVQLPRGVAAQAMGVFALASLLLGCQGEASNGPETPSPSPTTDPIAEVVPGVGSGPTQITFLGADPAPGSSVPGCGRDIAGCRGRLRIVFRLLSPSSGPVLRMNAFLHSPAKIACLLATTAPFDLPAGSPVTKELVFDQSDACATPVDMVTMDAVISGPVQVESRQEWGVRYTFGP